MGSARTNPYVAARAVDLAHMPPLRLGTAEVRPASREIIAGDRREIIEPLVMQVLVTLAAARGTVLSRDDLIAACWEGRAISDDAINRVLSKLRALAGKYGGFQIETIVKVGYRLVDDPAAPETVASTAAAMNRRMAITGSVAALVAAGGAGWLWLGPALRKRAETDRLMDQAQAAFRAGMPDDMARAAALYRLVLNIDPGNVDAWSWLAHVYRHQWEFGDRKNAPAMLVRARSAAMHALELDPANGDARSALAMMTPIYGHWAKAEADMRPVQEQGIRSVYSRLARLLSDVGRSGEALSLMQQLMRKSPENPRRWNFHIQLLWDNGRIEEAETSLNAAMLRWPQHPMLWFTRLDFLAHTGRASDAIAFAADRGARPTGLPARAFALAELEVRALATRAKGDVDAATNQYLAACSLGKTYAERGAIFSSSTGRIDDALHILDGYYFGRGLAIPDTNFGAETDSYYTPRRCDFLFSPATGLLRADPRFTGLVDGIGLAAYWRTTGTMPDYRRPA